MMFGPLAALLLVAGPILPAVSPEVRSQLAPTGKLRVGLILSNQVLVSKDPSTGEVRGVTVELGKALAAHLGVPFVPVGYANPAELVRSFNTGAWDIAFLAYDPQRAQDVSFSPPYMEVDNTYLVLPNSPVQGVEGADRAGIRIAVPERSAPDLYLSRNLQHATVVRVPGGAGPAIEALTSGKADAYAENAHMLTLYAEQLPGARVLEGRYTVIRHAMATNKGNPATASYVREFVEHAKASGLVAEAMRTAGLKRTRVAP